MTTPYAPTWLQPAAPGMLSNRRGSNQTTDAVILKARYSNPNSADRPGSIRATASRTTIAGVPASTPQSVWDSGFIGNISSTAFPYNSSIGGIVAPVGPNSIAQWRGRVYVLVADQRTTSPGTVAVIYSAPVSGATVGAWRLENVPSDALNGTTSGEICNPGALVVVAGYIYLLTTRTIWQGNIQGDGTITGWNDNINTSFELSPGVFPTTPVMMAGYDMTGWNLSSIVTLTSSGAHAFGFLLVFDNAGVCYRYLVDTDGDLEVKNGTDTAIQPTLPAVRTNAAIHIDDFGYVFVVGGETLAGAPQTTVYYATCAVGVDGSVGSWSTSGTPVTAARSRMAYMSYYKSGSSRSGTTQFISAPSSAPTVTPQAGATTLPGGTYTFLVTYVNINGETTGSATANGVVTAGQQVQLQATSVPSGVIQCNFYLTVRPAGPTLGFIGGAVPSSGTATLIYTTPSAGNGVSAPNVNTTDASGEILIAGGIQSGGGAGQTTIYSIHASALVTATTYNAGWTTATHPLTSAVALGGGATLERPVPTFGVGEDPPYASNAGHPAFTIVGGGVTTPMVGTSDDALAVVSGTSSSLSAGVLGTGGAVVVNADGTVDVTFQFNAFGPLSWLSTFSDGDQVQFTVQFTDFNAGSPSPVGTTVVNIGQPPTVSSVHPNTPGDPNPSGSPQCSFQFAPGGGGGVESTWRMQVLQRYQDTIMSDGPRGYWRMDGTGATETDVTGLGSTGTYSGTVTRNVTGALQTDSDKAITPDGSTGFLDIGSPSTIVTPFQNHDFSIEFWEKHTITGSSFLLMSFGVFNTTGQDQFFHVIFDSTGHIRMGFFGDDMTSPNIQSASQWNHIVMTWSAATKQRNIYVNGTLDTSGVSSGALNIPNGSDLTVGKSSFGTGNGPFFFGGSLDELAVFNYVLTPTQVKTHYNQAFFNTAVSIADSGVRLDSANLFSPNISPRLTAALSYGLLVTTTSTDSPMSLNDSTQSQTITFFTVSIPSPIAPVNASSSLDSTLMALNVSALVPAPVIPPGLADGGAAGTTFHVGQFQLVYTYLMADGSEGPPGPMGSISLAAGGNQISVSAINGLPSYVTNINMYAILVPTGDVLGLIAHRSVVAGTMSAFNITAQAVSAFYIAGPPVPWIRVLHRRSGTTTWTMLADNLPVIPAAQLTFGPFMDQLAWGATYDFAVQCASSVGDSAVVVVGSNITMPTVPTAGGAGMLHVAGNGPNQFVKLLVQGGVKVTTKMDAQAAEVFGVAAPTIRYGVLKFREIEAKILVLDSATMKAFQAVRDQALLGSTLYWRDSAGHVFTVGLQPEISLDHWAPSYLAQRPMTLKLTEIPNTYSPSTQQGQVRGNFQQVNGTVVPLDPSEVAV